MSFALPRALTSTLAGCIAVGMKLPQFGMAVVMAIAIPSAVMLEMLWLVISKFSSTERTQIDGTVQAAY